MKSGVMGEAKKCCSTRGKEGTVWNVRARKRRRREIAEPKDVVATKPGVVGEENKSAPVEGHRGCRISRRKEGALRGAARWSVPPAIVRRIAMTP
jgi:hypothetical protein